MSIEDKQILKVLEAGTKLVNGGNTKYLCYGNEYIADFQITNR